MGKNKGKQKAANKAVKASQQANAATTQFDPVKIFRLAEEYNKAGSALQQIAIQRLQVGNGKVHLLKEPEVFAPPSMVNAFACELYLKCLLCMDKGLYPDTHQYTELIGAMNLQTVSRLKKIYQSIIAQHPKSNLPGYTDDSFEEAIRRSNAAFVKFRYFYEGMHTEGEGWFGGRIVSAARELILETNPSWKQ